MESKLKASAPALRPWLVGVTLVVSVASLCGPLAASGVWDPHELEVAELARRIAHTLLGAEQLALSGGNNEVPIQSELGRGELPFISIALGFRLFGLHDWAGRLPLALYGLAGLLALYLLMARLSDRVAALFSVLVLSTMPLYFVQARTMLGDIVTMVGLTAAIAGLALACYDDRVKAFVRTAYVALALVGMAGAFLSRGLLVGVALPSLSVGAGWVALVTTTQRAGSRTQRAFGAACLVVGLSALGAGVSTLFRSLQTPAEYSMIVGSAVGVPKELSTFDVTLRHLGHALFPWSALVPFAIGRTLGFPPELSPIERERQLALRVTLIASAVLGFAVFGGQAPLTGELPFAPVFALAAVCGLFVRDLELGAKVPRSVGLGVVALAFVLMLDFEASPSRIFEPFRVSGSEVPMSFEGKLVRFVLLGTPLAAALFLLASMESLSQPFSGRRLWLRYLIYLDRLRASFGAALLTLEGGLFALFVAFQIEPFLPFAALSQAGVLTRGVARWGWLALPALSLVAPLVVLFVRDLFRSLTSPGFGNAALSRAGFRVRLGRPMLSLLSLVGLGMALSVGVYPKLMSQLSPKHVFATYERLSQRGEPLALLEVGSGSHSYYQGSNVPAFSATSSAFEWLMAGDERRFLAARSEDLAELNALYRGRAEPVRNLPVLDARSSEILLVSNQLRPGERNQNPFVDWVLDERPRPAQKLDANLGGKLELLGWEIRSLDGALARAVVPGREYELVIYYEVKAKISGKWQVFVHIDGFQRRFNADHAPLQGRYPLRHWRRGDFLADVHRFTLEPNFTPGQYRVYLGLFMDERRLDVRRGPHHDDRVEAGVLTIL